MISCRRACVPPLHVFGGAPFVSTTNAITLQPCSHTLYRYSRVLIIVSGLRFRRSIRTGEADHRASPAPRAITSCRGTEDQQSTDYRDCCKRLRLPGPPAVSNTHTASLDAQAKPEISNTSAVSATLGIGVRGLRFAVGLFPQD